MVTELPNSDGVIIYAKADHAQASIIRSISLVTTDWAVANVKTLYTEDTQDGNQSASIMITFAADTLERSETMS